jgi:hypothetical protein
MALAAGGLSGIDVREVIPLAVAALVLYLLVRRGGMRAWHAAACVLAGVLIAGSVIGPQVSGLLSQVSGGYLP